MKLIGFNNWTLKQTLELIPNPRIPKESPKICKRTENNCSWSLLLSKLVLTDGQIDRQTDIPNNRSSLPKLENI